MYLEFFALKEYPFNITPDPSFFYVSKRHEEALSAMMYGIQMRKGFIEVTGDVGSGKTTICRCLLNRLDSNVKTALILNPHMSDAQILRTICQEFEISVDGTSKKDYFDAINQFLLDQLVRGGNVVLIIDEAQNLRAPILEQIRILSNLETEKDKLIQIILIGQPELRELLSKPNLRQLRQRISVRFHLGPLNRKEMEEYIFHRLQVASRDGVQVEFAQDAIDQIFQYTGGVPRMVNIICDRCMLASYVKGLKHVSIKNVLYCIKEVEGNVPVSS
ncbi:MAG: AAA family ATPase [Chlamydiota bacterium]|nr:AAA family ATPase [Chlamydiota bacterium]